MLRITDLDTQWLLAGVEETPAVLGGAHGIGKGGYRAGRERLVDVA